MQGVAVAVNHLLITGQGMLALFSDCTSYTLMLDHIVCLLDYVAHNHAMLAPFCLTGRSMGMAWE